MSLLYLHQNLIKISKKVKSSLLGYLYFFGDKKVKADSLFLLLANVKCLCLAWKRVCKIRMFTLSSWLDKGWRINSLALVSLLGVTFKAPF